MNSIKQVYGVSDDTPMTPLELDLRLMNELAQTWKVHVRRQIQDCRSLKAMAAAERDVVARYQARLQYRHSLEILRHARSVLRSIISDRDAIWQEYLGGK